MLLHLGERAAQSMAVLKNTGFIHDSVGLYWMKSWKVWLYFNQAIFCAMLCHAITLAHYLCLRALYVTLNNTLDQIIALRTLLSWWLVFVQGKAQIYCNRTWCKSAKAYISIFLSIVSRVHASAQRSELVCAWFCTEDKEAVPCREALCTGCTEILCFSLLLQQVVQGRDCCGVWVCVCVCADTAFAQQGPSPDRTAAGEQQLSKLTSCLPQVFSLFSQTKRKWSYFFHPQTESYYACH